MSDKRPNDRYELVSTETSGALIYRIKNVPIFFDNLERSAKLLDQNVDVDPNAPIATVTDITQAPSYSEKRSPAVEKTLAELQAERDQTNLDSIRADIAIINLKREA